MAQLWGGRFTKETDRLAYQFNASIHFDQRFLEQDIEGSIAHAAMLAKQGILTEEEKAAITDGLAGIREDVKAGRLAVTDAYEDVHSFVEANLIERIGDAGKKLHTGRSRNDQVALDMKLYVRKEIQETDGLLKELLEILLTLMEENLDTVMPGFTHMQKAQPTTLAHHLGAYFEMFRRDNSRFADIRRLINGGRISEAEELLDGVPSSQRDGEWSFLKGYICYSRGWLDQAVSYFQTACQQDPGNPEYRNALNQLMWQQQTGFPRGGYQTMGGAGCSVCDLCVALWCTDCLCSFCH